MANGNDADVASAVIMKHAIPDVSLHLGNGKTVRGRYIPPDMSITPAPPDAEHVFAANNGIRVSANDAEVANDPKTLAKRMETALKKKEEERKKRKRETARAASSA